MFLFGPLLLWLLWFCYRKWHYATGPRRRVWTTFLAGTLLWLLGLGAWFVVPLWASV